jgi:hypothetical protein
MKVEYRGQVDDLTHQSQFVSREELKGFLDMQNKSNNNPPKDPVDRKESDMSIGTQPGEEIMQSHRMIKASE